MSQFYVYISTKTTADPYLPPTAANITQLARDTSDALLALSGGRLEVGSLAFYPVQRSVPNHLLCDGREVDQATFPELYAYLGDSGGTAATGFFKLPDYLTAFAAATSAVTETVVQGTVTTPPPTTPPPTYNPTPTYPIYGGVDSGGRYYNINPYHLSYL